MVESKQITYSKMAEIDVYDWANNDDIYDWLNHFASFKHTKVKKHEFIHNLYPSETEEWFIFHRMGRSLPDGFKELILSARRNKADRICFYVD